ncbi:putative ribonuclease H-like domain-containing protein [Tanacetum coccineum]|uniref:Ribonuclease H-like domain-containing protein n=1 Tax=Tanacetum coccineum TaxID=301880 RepID=A0ABQ5CE89_9ASTR
MYSTAIKCTFPRECRAPRSKDNINWNQGSSSKAVMIEDASEKAMCAIDGVGFDWSDIAEEEIQANMGSHGILRSETTPVDLHNSGPYEEFKQPEVNEYGPRDSSVNPTTGCDKENKEPKKARENNDAPIIEDWVSDDEDEVEPIPKISKDFCEGVMLLLVEEQMEAKLLAKHLKENGVRYTTIILQGPYINTGSKEVITALPEVKLLLHEELWRNQDQHLEDSHMEDQKLELGTYLNLLKVPPLPYKNHKDNPNEHGIDYDEVFAPVARIEAIRLFLAYASYMGFMVYQMDVKSAFLYGQIEEEMVSGFSKASHLLAVKESLGLPKGKPSIGLYRKSTTRGCQFLGNRLISWQCKKQTVVATSTTEAEYVAAASCCGQIDTEHNVADLLTKGFDAGRFQYLVSRSAGFHQIIDFLNRSHICYALTKKPEVCVSFIKQFWRSAEVTTAENGEVKITATIDGHSMTITEGSLRRHLKLDDQDGISSIPNSEIFEQLALMGYHTDSDKLTFQKGAFSPQWRFLIHSILHCLSPKKTAWDNRVIL